jgi:hypothetical protein
MLTEGRARFNEMVASVGPEAQQALRLKEQFVVNYFREVWNIDFYSLQTRVQNALNAQLPPLTVEEAFGAGKTYTTASVDPAEQTLLPQRASWMALYNEAEDSVALIPGFGLVMDSMAVIMAADDAAIIRMYIHQGTLVTAADFIYDMTVNNGVYSFTYFDENGNGEIVRDAVSPLLDYFSNNQFRLSWYADPSTSIYARVKFAPVATPNNYFLGLLLP